MINYSDSAFLTVYYPSNWSLQDALSKMCDSGLPWDSYNLRNYTKTYFDLMYELLLEIKSKISHDIEGLRKSKKIGKNLDIGVDFFCGVDAPITAEGLREFLGVSVVEINWIDPLENYYWKIRVLDEEGMLKCPRCWHVHKNIYNFGHEEGHEKYHTEKLCDNCERTILACFPEHEAVKFIKENYEKLGRKMPAGHMSEVNYE